jgi:amino acid adenylation domain-containing protein
MNPVKIIATFLEKGIILSAENNQLRFNAPVGALTAELRQILTENKQAILQHLQKGPIDSATPIPELRPNLARPPIPLSFAQQRLWFLEQWQPGGTAYLQTYGWRLQGPLDPGTIEASVKVLMARQDSLRTSFSSIAEHPVQVIGPPTPISLPLHDLTALSESDREEQLQRLVHQDTQQAFDLTLGPLWRVQLIRLGPEEHVLLFTIHHIITDGWSMGIIWKELGDLYSAHLAGQPASLPPLPLQYADFAVWQRQWLQGEVLQRQLTYWRTQLAQAPSSLELPTEAPRPPQQTYRGKRIPFTLPVPLTQALKTLSRQEGVTLFMVLLAAFQILLFRYTDQRDILVGAPIAGRTQSLLEGLIGFFVNTLVLRTQFKGQPTFRDVLRQVRKTCLEAYAHQDLPFEKLVEVLQPARDLSRHPLFQFMFQLFSQPNPDFSLPGLQVTPEPIPHQSAKFDLNCTLRERTGYLQGSMEYSSDLFTLNTIQHFVGHYQHLLEGIVANPDQQIATLPLLPQAERQQLLVEWPNTARDYPRDACLHDLVHLQVGRTPEAIALVCEDHHLTYRELTRRATQLANYLVPLGVGPEVRVGLCHERSPELIIGLLGILQAGGAYVPLDPTYPMDRLRFMLQDSQVAIVVTQEKLEPLFPQKSLINVCLDRDWAIISGQPATQPATFLAGNTLAYVMYTSGSTGRPKGVQIAYREVVNFLLDTDRKLKGTAPLVLLATTSLSFDISILELFWPLIFGGRVILASQSQVRDGQQLVERLFSESVTMMHATPAGWRLLLEANWEGQSDLVMLSGGEALSEELANQLLNRGDTLWNLYGPTETTIYSTCAQILSSEKMQITIGSPIANTQTYILDTKFQPVPIGIPGELYISGEGLSRGYLNRPDLTAERFFPNPFSQSRGKRLYRTGDRARYRDTGNIEWFGRLDHQVKLRGFRIELGEIEKMLMTHPAVQNAVVLCREDTPNEKQLVAYVIPATGASLEPAILRTYLQTKLPDYMLPAAFVLLDTLPLTPNGKVDRRTLPLPDQTHRAQATASVSPRMPMEDLLAELWRDLLKVDKIGVHDNFFALGGHSLLATQMVARLRTLLQTDVSVRTLFDCPTIAQLSATLPKTESPPTTLASPPLRPQKQEGPPPLSFAQQRLWFLEQWEPENTAYLLPYAWRLRGPLDVVALEASLTALVARHESLRTACAVVEEQPVQTIFPASPVSLPFRDLTALSEPRRDDEAQRLIHQEALQPFDLTTGPLWRGQLLRLGPEDHVLLLTFHHIITDGWSMGIVFQELSARYTAQVAGQPAMLPPLPFQYADFAIWQRHCLQGEVLDRQLTYWRTQLADVPPSLELPTDCQRPPQQTYQGQRLVFTLPTPLTQALKMLSQQEGVTLFMTLLAAFQLLLFRYTGQRDVLVGTPIAGRTHADLEGLIGFFVNTLVIRTQLKDQPTVQDLLQQVKETCLNAFAHQDVPFEKLVEALQPVRDPSRHPIFQVMFQLHHADSTSELTLSHVQTESLLRASHTAKFDLLLSLVSRGDNLHGYFTFNTDLFALGTMTRLAKHYQILLESVTADPGRDTFQLPLLTEAERHQLLVEWNPPISYQDISTPCVHHLVETQAARTPDAVAVVCENQQVTYRELNDRANQLAQYLLAQGVDPEARVGICLERGLELIISQLSILKVGGAYVPIDPATPTHRIAKMLSDAQVLLVLTQVAQLQVLPQTPIPLVTWETLGPQLSNQTKANPMVTISFDQLAYLIYTSGSTGTPKGIAISHRALQNHMNWMQKTFAFSAEDRILQKTSISFDASVWECWMPLITGGSVVLAESEDARDLARLVQRIRRHQITHLQMVPSVLTLLVQEPDLPACRSLRHLFSGGENLSHSLQQTCYQTLPVSLHNLYGPTETTIDISAWTCQPTIPSSHVPIGRPITNAHIFLVDKFQQLVPIGVTGELLIGGVPLSRGYWNQADWTAERFHPNPYSDRPGARLYRTGDLARFHPDGTLEYLGRRDHQVKVRGFRIELGEIESILFQHPSVQYAVVLCREDTPGEKQLVAYVVSTAKDLLSKTKLRAFLHQKLPDYMIPTVFMMLDALPLKPNGKIDRGALPVPDNLREQLETIFVPPRTPIEDLLVGIWGDLLKVEKIGVHDNFFALGGHSLLATQVIARLRQALELDIPLRTLFEHPTIAQFAREIDRQLAQAFPDWPSDEA